MGLLLSRVENNTISIVEKCHSDIIIRYLHTSAHTFTEGLESRTVQHRDYALIPPAHEG